MRGAEKNSSSSGAWFTIGGVVDSSLVQEISAGVERWRSEAIMPPNEPERVARVSTAIATESFRTSPERLELLRGLCQIYSAGIRAEKISSHRAVIGPCIVLVKKVLFRAVSTLMGPSFQHQRDFNAGVIRLLGDLCNEEKSCHRDT